MVETNIRIMEISVQYRNKNFMQISVVKTFSFPIISPTTAFSVMGVYCPVQSMLCTSPATGPALSTNNFYTAKVWLVHVAGIPGIGFYQDLHTLQWKEERIQRYLRICENMTLEYSKL